MENKYIYTSIDLFSGPGGLCTGFKAAGIKPLIAVEWSEWTAQTYAATHDAEIMVLSEYLENKKKYDYIFKPSDKTVLILGDVNKVKSELIKKILKERFKKTSVDIVTGGAPCESFSMAGDREIKDDRNQLFQNIPRIAKDINAKVFMFENVKGLFSKKKTKKGKPGGMYTYVCNFFEKKEDGKPSYRLASKDQKVVLLKASDYGVPQNRERLFLVGINNDYPDLVFSYPQKTHGDGKKYEHVTVSDAIEDLPAPVSDESDVQYSASKDSGASETKKNYLRWERGEIYTPNHLRGRENVINSHKEPGHLSRIKDRFAEIKVGENQRTAYERLLLEGASKEHLDKFPKTLYGARNRRLKPDEPSFTVTSHCLDEMLHPSLNRSLTPREAARLQSFPDWYVFKGPFVQFHGDKAQDRYEQIGDAIPPLLAFALAKELVKMLNGEGTT